MKLLSKVNKISVLLIILTIFTLSGLGVFKNQVFAFWGKKELKSTPLFKMAFVPDLHFSFEQKDDWILYNESFVILVDTINQLNKIKDLDFIAQ